MSNYGFDLAFGMRPNQLDPKVGTHKLYFINITNYINAQGNSARNRTDTEVELIPCGTDNFNYPDKNEIITKGIPSLYCVKNKSLLRVRSTLYAPNMNMFEVRYKPCVDSTKVNNIGSSICYDYPT
jgi:hypothetical protein